MIGRTIAHYQILEKLGEGGMGVVYKARDTHLDRFVAIKVLPPERVTDPERKRRFVQEAKAASALNHPNIITIYDIDKADGVDFIAMEFVAGKTLDQLTGRKGLKLNETLKYAVQIADALATAHAAGIVHRDLKPGNVMVTNDGLVKVLDFGLAKLTEVQVSPEALTVDRKPHTEEGAIVGTVAYMSPEQAEGKPVDARSDIFTFGSVLYEMVTGRRAFKGDSPISTLSAILHHEPAPMGEEAPGELRRVVTRCLRKDPARRFQTMADLKVALEELKEESDSGKLVAGVPGRRKRVSYWLLFPALALLLAAVASVTWWLTRVPKPAPAPVLTRLTSDSGLSTDPALSPDGKLLAYASDRSGDGNLDIWVRQVAGGEPIRLTRDPADEYEPAFSPDGTQIVFRSEVEGGAIYVVSALGGPARRIIPGGRCPQFSPDGNWIAYWLGVRKKMPFLVRKGSRMYVAPAAGGAPRQLQPDFFGAAYPIWSPDGKHLLFLGHRDDTLPPEESVDWWVTPLEPGPAVRTGAFEATRREKLSGPVAYYSWALVPAAWEPAGDSLIFSARFGDSTNLWRIGISPRTWKVTGAPRRLTSGPTLEEKPAVAAAAGGAVRVAFAAVTENVDIWSLPVAANQGKVTGEPRQLTHDAAADFHPALSPDGSKMVFVSARTGSQEIWIKDLRSGEESALTATRSQKYWPLFSPDGSRVSFSSYENLQRWKTYVVPATGGAPEMLCEGLVTSWSSDGKRVLHHEADWRVRLLDLPSRLDTELFAAPGRTFCCGHFSPDDHWIAFLDNAAWRSHVAPFQGEARVPESAWIDLGEGRMWFWSPDGALLYGQSSRDGHECLWAQRVDRATKRPAGEPLAIFHSHGTRRSIGNQTHSEWFVASDQILFSMGERTGNIWMAEFR